MDYLQVTFSGDQELLSLLEEKLALLPVDGSYLEGEQLISSMPLDRWSPEWEIRFRLMAQAHHATVDFAEVQPKDWNAIWESSFQPYEIDDFCRIRATFHPADSSFKHEIVIDPKMAFGTGHHETTSQMIQLMRKMSFRDRRAMDFGAGTGILGILAAFCKANQVWCIENDPVACENLRENVLRNGTSSTTIVLQNSYDVPLPKHVDVLLMNITRNTIQLLLPTLVSCLNPSADVLLSGFLVQDKVIVIEMCTALNMKVVTVLEKNSWLAIHLRYL